MQSKISSLAAIAAVAALVTPALAGDDHLAPVPGDVDPEVAATTGGAAKDAALPTDAPILFPEINGFPKPPAPGYQDGKADTTKATTPTTYTTWCPDPTVITWGKLTTSVTTKGYVTLTDCEQNTTTTTTPYTPPVIPTDHPQPHPYPNPKPEEEHEGEHGEKHEEERDGKSPETTAYPPVKPPPTPPHTVTPAPPTKTPVIVSGASKTQSGIIIGVAVAAVWFAVFGL